MSEVWRDADVQIWVGDNGYVVRTADQFCVTEDDDTERGACVATAHLLYAILDAIGARGSKHDAYRVQVSVIKQATGEDVLYAERCDMNELQD